MQPDYANGEMHGSTMAVRSITHTAMPATDHNRIGVAIYDNEIPEFVEAALEKIYCSIYCTVRRFGVYDSLAGVSTYVATDDGKIETLILFRIVGRAVYVLNQQIQLRTEQMAEFSESIFARYRTAARIEFYALDATIGPDRFSFPCQVVPGLEEQVIQLPDTEEMYVQDSQARSIRRWIKTFQKLQADHPSCRFDVLRREEITKEHVQAIVGLADKRMHSKHKSSYVEESQIVRFAELARSHGFVGLIYIHDEIRAGVLCYIAGNRCFVQLIGHDPEWNNYALGNIVQFQIILLCIRQGIKEVLLMGGGDEAKARFMAHRKIFNSITVYRPGSLLGNWKRYLGNETKVMVYTCRQVVKHKTTQSGLLGRTLAGLVAAARATRTAGRSVQQIVARPTRQQRCRPSRPDASGMS